MPPSSKDPKEYIKRVPLPIPSHKGIIIQARSDLHYNPTLPTRDEVRRANYSRRLKQMAEQGFKSVNYRPYQGIGDPLYLDQKKLILYSLGQWEEGQEMDTSSSSSSDEDENGPVEQQTQQKSRVPPKFVLRKRDLNTLEKEVAQSKHMMRNVRLGHGLFQIVRQQKLAKSTAKQKELRKKREQERNAWKPPSYDSSTEDETDEELVEEVDLGNYMTASSVFRDDDTTFTISGNTPQPPTTGRGGMTPQATASIYGTEQTRSRVAFQGVENQSTLEVPKSAKSTTRHTTTPRSSSKKKLGTARPYTPQHANIVTDCHDWPSRTALFRQLCALYWILEAMNVEPPQAMGPILLSWDLKDVGGSKTTIGKQQKEKLTDTKWKQFVSNQTLRVSKRYSTALGRLRSTTRKVSMFNNRASISSGSPSGSQSQLNIQCTPGSVTPNVKLDNTIPEDGEMSTGTQTQVDTTTSTDAEDGMEAMVPSKGVFNFLNEYYESLSREQNSAPEGDTTSTYEVGSARSDLSAMSPRPTDRRRDRRNTEIQVPLSSRRPVRTSRTDAPPLQPSQEEFEKRLESITRSHEDPRFHALAHGPQDKMSSRQLRADIIVRPKSSPALLEYQAQLPSNKVSCLPLDMRQKFAEVAEEQALLLHDELEACERRRMRVLQNKFVNMPTGGSSFHRALDKMRNHSGVQEDKTRKSAIYQEWFADILANIPEEILHDWYFQKIIGKERLSKYGMVESSKQSQYKFLKVLANLRDWEICSPDISAAIEFCREKIVEMPVEEYESWFRQQFPYIVRPQTAPPALNNGKERKKKDESQSRAPRSAPPGGNRGVTE